MEIQRLTSFDEINNAFNALKDNFFDFKDDIEAYAMKIYQNGICYAGIINDTICGLIAFYANNTNTRTAFITSLLVDKFHRKQGVASALLKALEEYCVQREMVKISLEVNKLNDKAIALYTKFDYKPVSSKHISGDDATFFMEKSLILPKINVTRSSIPSYEEYCDAIKPIFETVHLTNMGSLHNELSSKLCDYLGCGNVSLFTNGHLALCAAIQALELTGEVITTPFTFASTTHAIVQNGLTPVFCDINPDNYTIDADKLEELITEKTSAIIPIHVYGNICDVEKIERIANKYNLKVIYDAAHVFGVKYKNNSICRYGDISMMSFHATKVFNTIEGGGLAYADDTLSDKLSAIRNFGIDKNGAMNYIGTNAKMNEFQAAMGLCNLKHIDTELEKRKAVDEKYRKHLSDIPGIKLSPIQKDVTRNYAYFPVVFDGFKSTRDEIAERLADKGIFARKYFYPPTNEFPCYAGKYTGETPIASEISRKILCLPMYADLSLNDVERICRIILE